MTDDGLPAAWPKGAGRPALNALLNIGVERLDDLTRYTEAELLAIHGVGPKAIRVLRETLAERGLAFREPDAAR